MNHVNAHAGFQAHHLVAGFQIARQYAAGPGRLGFINGDGGVHALALHAQPLAVDMHIGGIDRRAAEILRCDAVAFDDRQSGVIAFVVKADARAAFESRQPSQLRERIGQHRFVRRRHLQARVAGLIAAFATAKALDADGAAGHFHGIEGAIEDASTQQVALQRQRLGANRRSCSGTSLGSLLIQQQGQALGGAACLDELGERRHRNLETPLLQLASQCGGGVADDQRLADTHGVAGETGGILGTHFAAIFGAGERFQKVSRSFVERRRIVDQAALGQRHQAGVEMIETRIGQAQRQDANAETFGQQAVRLQAAAHAVAGAENRLVAPWPPKRVPLALEGDCVVRFDDGQTCGLHPFTVVRNLRGALENAEVRAHEGAVEGEAGVGREAHVRQAGLRLDGRHIAEVVQQSRQRVPLAVGDCRRGRADIAAHPRVDDVFHAEVRRRTEKDFCWERHQRHERIS